MTDSTLKANGVHHLAICTADIKAQIGFFSDVLGMELVALYWMHGVEGAWHGFLKANDLCYLAFVQTDAIKDIPIEYGKTHAGSGALPSAPGTMQHLALNVDTLDELLNLRDRIRSRGVNVLGPIDHGMCQSIYFAGPEGLTLEIATSEEPIDARAWIDPEVVELAGISAEELERFRRPAAYAGEGGKVPQPPIDPSKPHMRYPPALYEKIMAMPDEEFTRLSSMPDPPVKVRE
jgi:catechol 2,3-dioxygenase-like lactoylglutathione lyase family enzyme